MEKSSPGFFRASPSFKHVPPAVTTSTFVRVTERDNVELRQAMRHQMSAQIRTSPEFVRGYRTGYEHGAIDFYHIGFEDGRRAERADIIAYLQGQ